MNIRRLRNLSCWAVVAGLLFQPSSFAATEASNVMLKWNSAALEGARDSDMGAPMVSRALAIVHTCIYAAWAAYDDRAIGTQLRGALRRPVVPVADHRIATISDAQA